jgi:protein-S-isoprenylcysteine O-methyltransferase Ste14
VVPPGQAAALGVPAAVSFWRHARAVVLLPGTVTVVIPALILWFGGAEVDWTTGVIGGVLIGLGFALWVWTVKLFVTIGRGTLAPWDPTKQLVVAGPYRHVRNPMITGVAMILAGEAVFFRSWGIAIELAIFVIVNAIYFPLAEEPGLRRRFGDEFDTYAANVPRWLPRLRPWNG